MPCALLVFMPLAQYPHVDAYSPWSSTMDVGARRDGGGIATRPGDSTGPRREISAPTAETTARAGAGGGGERGRAGSRETRERSDVAAPTRAPSAGTVCVQSPSRAKRVVVELTL